MNVESELKRTGIIAILIISALGSACSSQPSLAPSAEGSLPEVVPVTIVEEPPLEPAPLAEPTPAPGPLTGRRICIDPGHDAYWVVGASGKTRTGVIPRHPADQIPLHEHELTLSVSYRLKTLLEEQGAEVCVTRKPRNEGGGLAIVPYDYTGDGRVRTQGAAVEDGAERIQPRIDVANAFGTEVLLSVHFNGSEDRLMRGTEVFYSDTGPREAEGRRLASSVLASLLAEMRAYGHNTVDRGIKSDRYQRYSPEETRRFIANHTAIIRAHGHNPANCTDCYRLLTLGNNPMALRMGAYVGAMVEVDFLSNPDVVEGFILRPESLDVIAQGLLRGLKAYFETD